MVSGEEHPAAQTSALGNYVAILRRRFIYVATILPGVVFICVVAAFAIRPQYQSSAVIMLEPSSVPKDIIESTVLSYSDQQIEIVQGRVMTVEGLQRIVQEIDPYPGRVTWTPAEKAQHLLEDTSLEKVDPVTMKPQAESNAFSLHYDNPDPAIAVAIDQRLAQLFLTYNQIRRTEAAGEAAGFLQKQSEQVADQMRQVDTELAALKNKYGEALPEFLGRNQSTVEDLPAETLVFLLGSRYCETDRLSEVAWKLFGHGPLGWARVQSICDFVHRHIAFGYEHASATKTAWEVYTEGRGVCRDYAHLAIAFCRCMNIPARYCTGYLGDVGTPPPWGVGDFAAWIEVYLGGRWLTFDPRNNVPRMARVLMARGRDASDVAIATTFGPNVLESFKVWTDEIATGASA